MAKDLIIYNYQKTIGGIKKMKKSYTIYKDDLTSFLSELSQAMAKAKTFYNVSTKPHKDDNKIIVIMG